MALTTNLTSYWKLDESSGNAADSVGSITLTNNNSVSYGAALINNGADFGVAWDSNKSLGNASGIAVNLASDFSIQNWVKLKTTTATAGNDFYTDWRSTATNDRYFIAKQVVNNLTCDPSGGTGINFDTTLWNLLVFHHIVWTVSSGTVTLYIDGSSQGTTTMGTGGTGSDTFFLGGNSTNGVAAIMDECGVWTRALSGAEITSLYNGGAGLAYPFTGGGSVSKNLTTLNAG